MIGSKKLLFFYLIVMCNFVCASPRGVADGGTGIASAGAYAILCGGVTDTSPWQSVASLGSAGQPLVSNGAGVLPSMQTLPIAGGGMNTTTLAAGVIESNSTALTSLGNGSNGQVLKNTSGTVGWAYNGLLQVVVSSTAARIDTSGTSIPDDDTIPQFSEGTLILSVSITPKSASSSMYIFFTTGGTPTDGTAGIVALFVNSGANAIAASYLSQDGGNDSYVGSLQHTVASGSTTARTYQIRIGGGAFQVNSGSSSQKFGGVASTYLVVMEYV